MELNPKSRKYTQNKSSAIIAQLRTIAYYVSYFDMYHARCGHRQTRTMNSASTSMTMGIVIFKKATRMYFIKLSRLPTLAAIFYPITPR